MIHYLTMYALGYRLTLQHRGISFPEPVWVRYRRGQWQIRPRIRGGMVEGHIDPVYIPGVYSAEGRN